MTNHFLFVMVLVMTKTRKCENCEFWKPDANAINGVCQRRAPKLIVIVDSQGGLSYFKDWADTNKNDWCGEFKGKGKETDDRSIRALHLSARARNVCRYNNITSIGQLREMSDDELKSYRLVGRITFREIRKKIERIDTAERVCTKTTQK